MTIFFILELDFWSDVGPLGQPVDFLVSPQSRERIEHYLAFYSLDSEILIEDLQSEIDEEDSSYCKNDQLFNRPKRQNSLLDLLPFFSSQPRFPRSRLPRRFPGTKNNQLVQSITSTSSNHAIQNKPTSSFSPNNSSKPGMI